MPDTELLAHELSRAVARYIEAADKDPDGHANEWSNVADLYTELGKFLIRTRRRNAA